MTAQHQFNIIGNKEYIDLNFDETDTDSRGMNQTLNKVIGLINGRLTDVVTVIVSNYYSEVD